MTEKFDVVIVGAGASGLSSSWYLVKSGLKVCCIEQGDYISNTNFIPIEKGGEIQKYNQLSFDPNIRKNNYDYNINSSNSPISIANFNGIGGSTVLFSAQYPRFHPQDFNCFSEDSVGFDWPIDYKDLKSFYDLNDSITGVSGLEGDPFYPDIRNLLDPVPLGKMGRKIQHGFKKLGWHCWPAYAAINTKEYDSRPKDNYLRPSNMGDKSGSKGSTDNTYLPKALKEGLVIKCKTSVIKIIEDAKKITKILCREESGNKFYLKANVFILAASGIGTPRILLNSKNNDNKNGLSNSSGLVGKNLMLHPLGYVEGFFKENLYSNVGPQGCCLISQQFYKTNIENNFKRGYTFQVLRGPLPIESALNLSARKIIKLGDDFLNKFLSIYNHTAHITVITEDLPEESNCIQLDNTNVNQYGEPGVSINYKLSENTKNMLTHGLSKGRLLMKESGAYKSFAFGPVRSTGWHIMGTCKMGNDPQNSVVNKYGLSHDISNLFIIDSSIFPTSAGVNPASTIQALSLYISEKIITRYKNLFYK